MSYDKVNLYGSKPRYTDPKKMQEKIDAYFKECEGTPLVDHYGDPVIDRWGNPIYIGKKPPTLTGLALALGFKTRTGLMTYKAKKEFTDTILEARTRIELYNEEQLYSREGSKGAMFNLARNFAGWQDKEKEDGKGAAVNIINDIPKGTVTVNTETAVFNPLQNPEKDTTADTESTENASK